MSQHTVEQAFDTPDPIQLFVENGRGSVTVTATEGQTTKVHLTGARADEVVVDQTHHGIRVVAPRIRGLSPNGLLHIEVSVPAGSDLTAKLGAARLETVGALDVVSIRSGSGTVSVDHATGSAVVTSGSGAVSITEADGELRVRSGSGQVSVGRVGSAIAVSTGSGSIRLGHCAGAVAAKTGSGAISVERADHDLDLRTGSGTIAVAQVRSGRATLSGGSGNVEVGIPAGVPVWTDLRTGSGRVRSSLPSVGQPEPGADYLELRASTGSGDVELTPV